MFEVVEFKVNSLSARRNWEDLPIAETLSIDKDSPVFWQVLNQVIGSIAQKALSPGDGCEIRWNWQGSYQGHYQDVKPRMEA